MQPGPSIGLGSSCHIGTQPESMLYPGPLLPMDRHPLEPWKTLGLHCKWIRRTRILTLPKGSMQEAKLLPVARKQYFGNLMVKEEEEITSDVEPKRQRDVKACGPPDLGALHSWSQEHKPSHLQGQTRNMNEHGMRWNTGQQAGGDCGKLESTQICYSAPADCHHAQHKFGPIALDQVLYKPLGGCSGKRSCEAVQVAALGSRWSLASPEPEPRFASLRLAGASLRLAGASLRLAGASLCFASPEPRFASPEPRLASPRRSLASPRRSLALPSRSRSRGLAGASLRLAGASPRWGRASPEPCLARASPRRGLAGALLEPRFASLESRFALPRLAGALPRLAGASPRRSLASPRRSLASPRRSLASPRRSLAGASPRRSPEEVPACFVSRRWFLDFVEAAERRRNG
ncbi:uncharacterized protein LOC144372436 [Ictidomys tridecemlineatus]